MWGRFIEKLNPAQPAIHRQENAGGKGTTQTKIISIQKAYEIIEVVNRCINIIVDNSSMVNYDIANTLSFSGQSGVQVKQVTLDRILNYRPNPYMDISTFRRLILMDFLLDGNVFIHFDGSSLYHLPANKVVIHSDPKTYVNHYTYDTDTIFQPKEIIHIQDNSAKSNLRGDSRINSCLESLYGRETMLGFQKSFFDNGAAIGLVVETDELLSPALKDKREREWMVKFNPTKSNGRPLILDGGMKAKSISNVNFREMAFSESILELETKVAVALGVPPILLNSGNNANIKPNLELMFYTTILPMLHKFVSAFEFYFAFDIEMSTHGVPALKPDLKEQAERVSSLVNNGIILGNEGRGMIRLAPLEDPVMNKIRIPANIAGSATGVSGQEGGKPAVEEN